MLKVAIVGCGKIADAHASQIQRIKSAAMVGVCDTEPLMARQLYERFPVANHYSDVERLLTEAKPDVVHITTPPQSHFALTELCLRSGANVYVEKPFTVTATEARQLIDLANTRQLRLTVGHDDQFTHAAQRMRAIVAGGYLGGPPVHMESHFCYDIKNATYARALLGDKRHWVRRLPGKLLHNIISHGIARIAEFLVSDSPNVIAHGFQSSGLKEIGETEILDELRVIIAGGQQTAYFTFSSQMRPSLHQFVAYGPENGLLLDQDHETVTKLPGGHYKSYLDKFLPPVVRMRQDLRSVRANVGAFVSNDFHPKFGMKSLIERYYRSIIDQTPVPIPYREILLTATIMDRIFGQIAPQAQGFQSERADTTPQAPVPVNS